MARKIIKAAESVLDSSYVAKNAIKNKSRRSATNALVKSGERRVSVPRATVSDLDPRIVTASNVMKKNGYTMDMIDANLPVAESRVLSRRPTGASTTPKVINSQPTLALPAPKNPKVRASTKKPTGKPVSSPRVIAGNGPVATQPSIGVGLKSYPTTTASPIIRNAPVDKSLVGPTKTKLTQRKTTDNEWKAAGNIRKQVKEKQKVINQLVEGGAPQPKPTAPTSMKNVASGMWGNIKDVGFADGDYLGSALTGALVGGTISGTNEWANGGSFTGGFKSGLVSGAIGGTAVKGLKVGAYGKNYAKHSVVDATGNIAGQFYKEQLSGKSKALSALETLRSTSSKHPTMG